MKKIFYSIVTIVLLTFPKTVLAEDMNFRFSPIGLLVGAVNVNLDISMGKSWTLGPQLSYWGFSANTTVGTTTSSTSVSSYGLGLRGNWHANGNFNDGLYFGPSVSYSSAKASASGSSGNYNGRIASALVGYGWFWNSFNILLGGVLNIPLGGSKITLTDNAGSTSEVSVQASSLALEFSLGWTF